MEESSILLFNQCRISGITKRLLDLEFRSGESSMIIFSGDQSRNLFLDTIYGFHPPQAGTILFEGEEYNYVYPDLKNLRRKISFISLEGSLISNLNIFENIRLPLLAIKEFKRGDINDLINEHSDKFEISGLLDKLPHQLSDFDKVKVELARGFCQKAVLFILNNLFEKLGEKKYQNFFEEILPKLPCSIALSKSERGLKLVDRVIILDEDGVIYNGSSKDFGKHGRK